MKTKQSPFKFLDSYNEKDNDIFFGREEEVNALYEKMSGVKLLLLYGPSGAGKTSLIECGLRNKFSRLDWYAITVRRGNNSLNSFFQTVNLHLTEPVELDKQGKPIDESLTFQDVVEQLFLEQFKPVYLLFDQFEELLILGDKEEQKLFFQALDALLRAKIACRVILILRDEFIGRLSEHEKWLPSLFRDRFRLEQMRETTVRNVLFKTLTAPRFKTDFEVAAAEEMTEKILEKLPDERNQIELAHAQVYLDRLYQDAQKVVKQEALPLLEPTLINEKDNLSSVLEAFLTQELKSTAEEYKELPEELPLEMLDTLTSLENTKLQRNATEVHQKLKKIPEYQEISFETIEKLIPYFTQNRILREIPFGEQGVRYELSHDLLARLVSERRSVRMKERRRAQALYQEYLPIETDTEPPKEPELLSKEEIARLERYEPVLPFPEIVAKRVENSKKVLAAAEAKRLEEAEAKAAEEASLRKDAETASKRARLFAWGAGALAVAALLIGGWAVQQRSIALEQKVIADSKTKEALDAKRSDSIAKVKADLSAKIADSKTKEALDAKRSDSIAKVKADTKTKEAVDALAAQKKAEEDTLNAEMKPLIEAIIKAYEAGEVAVAQRKFDAANDKYKGNPKWEELRKKYKLK